VVVGLVKGALGAAIFKVLGISSVVFWGATMALALVLPVVGAALIWALAALVLILGGAWDKQLILLAYGALIISRSNNIIRPRLVGRSTQLPDYVTLFATFGGITSFGISGIVIGPVIAALVIIGWQINTETAAQTDESRRTTVAPARENAS